jgi:hypothetical protein
LSVFAIMLVSASLCVGQVREANEPVDYFTGELGLRYENVWINQDGKLNHFGKSPTHAVYEYDAKVSKFERAWWLAPGLGAALTIGGVSTP